MTLDGDLGKICLNEIAGFPVKVLKSVHSLPYGMSICRALAQYIAP
jgi:hypothetical protein